MSQRFNIRFSTATHTGLVRQVNEDSLIAMPELGVWSVSDGMGGHAAGDYASQTVMEALAALPPDLHPTELMSAVRKSIGNAHQIIQTAGAEMGGKTIGATVVVLLIADGHFVSFWAGDSRLYRLRDGEIEMLTTDHSVVADLVLAGQMTWDEAEHHPQSNAITRAVGVGDDFAVDKVRGEIAPGDRFLLCSDGLTKYADSRMLQRILEREPMETVVDTLVNVALDGGGGDNISVIVVDVT